MANEDAEHRPTAHPARVAAPHIVFGGTFDPVHEGHLAVARAVRDRFHATVHFLPAGDPAHRTPPGASATHRLAMLQRALMDETGFAIDTRELTRQKPSRTIDTVEELDRELPAGTPLLLVIGMDSLRQFTTWLRWRDILARASLIACARPGQPVPTTQELGELAARLTHDDRELLHIAGHANIAPSGRVLIETATAANIAATEIRADLAARRLPSGLAPSVRAYIAHHHLYASGATNRA